MTSMITRAAIPPETETQYTYPRLVLGWESSRTGGSIVQPLVGGGVSITLQRPNPRSGTLRLFYLTEADAVAAELMHAVASVFNFSEDSTDPGSSPKDMLYVVADAGCRLTLDDTTRYRWVLEVNYQELEAF